MLQVKYESASGKLNFWTAERPVKLHANIFYTLKRLRVAGSQRYLGAIMLAKCDKDLIVNPAELRRFVCNYLGPKDKR